MQVRHVMTTDVVTVKPDTRIREIAKTLLKRRISAVPVVDDEEKLVGIVSEGDLMRRTEIGTDERESWWLALLADPEDEALEYVRTHGSRARDVMTRSVITVGEDATLREVAAVLEHNRIKRVPVVRDGKLVGIVSRANLLQGILTAKGDHTAPGDDAIRATILKRLREDAGVRGGLLNVTVSDGIVHLWGGIRSQAEREAVHVVADNVRGVKGIEDHLTVLPRQAAWSE
jgi:CBS domain-containing protein